MMRFLFFNAAGTILFERNDAENASVTHEQMSFQALFPYDPEKEIQRGMRVGYEDSLSVFQVFEIRKVRSFEPDHAQEVTAEHIAISELTDEFCDKAEYDNKTASQALSPLLTNTGWSIGNDTTSNTSSGDISRGDVWNATRTIQKNWNVYIIPRVVVGSSGITNKYLDIMPAGGTWRGFRVSLDKNASQLGVIWDDSKVKTALYAFGKETSGTPITFKDVVWTTAGGDPANKPADQTYVEDIAATTAYGRNGRPRFGYYQNASISNAEVLLQKTWEVLQTVNVPDVTIDSTITDLYKLGYVDVPIRLHDTALVEVRPTGVVLQKEIIQYNEDLLNPQNSRIVVGVYIPNIIYINRQNARRGGGGGGSGDSQTPQEYTTENNTVQISIDSNGLNSLCVGTGAQLNPDGSLVVDEHGNPIFIDGGSNMYSKITQNSSQIQTVVTKTGINSLGQNETLYSEITQNAGNITTLVQKTGINSLGQNETLYSQISQNATDITLKVSKGDVATQLSVECGNVSVTGGNLTVDGYVTSAGLATEIASLGYVECATMVANTFGDGSGTVDVGSVTAEGEISCDSLYANEIDLGGNTFTSVLTDASVSGNVLTITKGDGTTINFSKATTLTGGWSSGAYTVTATQNSETVGTNVTALTNTGHWGSGSGEDPNKYYYATYATINGGATPVATGNTTIIDATARYNAGAGSVTISSASRTNQSDSALSGDSSVGTAGYKYIVITATASNGATRTIAVNATPTYDAGVTAGEGKFSQADIYLAVSGYSFTRYGYEKLYWLDDDNIPHSAGTHYWYYRTTDLTGGTYYTRSHNTTDYYTKTS